jgi:hypothetical protein
MPSSMPTIAVFTAELAALKAIVADGPCPSTLTVAVPPVAPLKFGV